MWRTIKKWWLLQQLYKAISFHSGKESIETLAQGKRVLMTQNFFILGKEEYPGIAQKSVKRFSKILWWRRKDNPKKLKKRIDEYNALFEACIDEGYIKVKETDSGTPMPTTTHLADGIHGWFGLLQALLSKYYFAWTLIIIPLLLGAYGLPKIKEIISLVWNKLVP